MKPLIDFLNAIAITSTGEDLWQLYSAKMAGFGFDRVIYGFTRYRTFSSLGDPQDWMMLTNQSPEYLKHFVDGGHYFSAPMLKWAMENDGACSWSWVSEQSTQGKLTSAEQRMLDFNRQMGVTAGYTISFRSLSMRSKGAVALTAAPGMTQDDVDALWATKGDEILVINNMAHLKALTLPYTGNRSLTKRQREVLECVGDGKTTQDTADILGLTAATVEKHLRLAREALDVDTTAQAVLKASFQNQMFILDQ